MFDIESYYEASSAEEAVTYLAQNPDALIISGGTDVLIRLREGRIRRASLVGISRIPECTALSIDQDGRIFIGAAVTFRHIQDSPIVQQHLPLLALAVDQVGGPQIRNMGTLGGNLCNGMPSADSAPSMLAFEAQVHILSASGSRTCPVTEFYRSAGITVLEPGELVTGFSFEPRHYRAFGGHYIKYSMRKAMDIATVSCAVLLRLEADRRTIADARVCMGVVAPTPVRLPETESILQGCGPESFDTAAQTLRQEISPRSSWRAKEDFRRHIAGEIFLQAAQTAYVQAGGAVE